VADLLDEVYTKAGIWVSSVVCKAAGLRQMVDIGLSDAVTTIPGVSKQITVESLILRPR